MDARSFVVPLQLEAAGLKRITTEDKQRGKPAQYVDQSSALGSLLVEREDMQQAYGIKVLRAKTLRTSRQSSLKSRSERSKSRTSVKSASRTSQRSAKSKASVTSKTSGRAKSAGSSRRGSSNVSQKTTSFTSRDRTGKGKGRGRGSSRGRDNSNKGKTRGQKNGTKATRGAEIQIDQWRQQTQAETPFPGTASGFPEHSTLEIHGIERTNFSSLSRASEIYLRQYASSEETSKMRPFRRASCDLVPASSQSAVTSCCCPSDNPGHSSGHLVSSRVKLSWDERCILPGA